MDALIWAEWEKKDRWNEIILMQLNDNLDFAYECGKKKM